jgi:hypothetical protein
MSEADRHSLQLRATRARARLERRLHLIEERGRSALHSARRVATIAALVTLGLSGMGMLALVRALARSHRRHSSDAMPRRGSVQAGWALLGLAFAYAGARSGRARERPRRLPALLPAASKVQQTRLG